MKTNLASHLQCPLLKKKLILSILIITVVLFVLVWNNTIKTEENLEATSKCLFCDIGNGRQKPPELEFENEEFVIFKDKYPAATHHYLAIPKEHYASIKVLNKSHVNLVWRMQEGMIKFLLSKGVQEKDAIIGYHIPPFISQRHLHLHGISPISEMSLSNRISFFTPSFWFISSKKALASLHRSEL